VWPTEKNLTGEGAYYGSLLGLIEMVKSGTTSFVDMYFYCKEVARAVEEVGIRGYIGSGIFDFPSPESEAPFETAVSFIEEYRDRKGLVVPVVAPHALYTCSEETFFRCLDLSEKYDLLFHTHVSETERDVKEFSDEKGMRPGDYLYENGFLRELDRFGEKGVKVSHNPVSNMKLAAGVMSLPDMMKRGIVVSLGTDGASSNNSLDMFETMKVCALLHKVHAGNPTVVSSRDVLEMATQKGAESLGLKAGVLQEGFLADIQLIDLREANAVPRHDLISNVVYSLSNRNVDTVICNGEIVMQDKKLKNIDEGEILEKTEEIAEDMVHL
jgi:5-methylthioadenosine/S-adenosylhomocysteine deaminase